MSTLAWELAGELAPADESASDAKPGLWRRLIDARQAKANRTVCAHLASMDDATLIRLGFGTDDIRALRSGELRLPKPAQGG